MYPPLREIKNFYGHPRTGSRQGADPTGCQAPLSRTGHCGGLRVTVAAAGRLPSRDSFQNYKRGYRSSILVRQLAGGVDGHCWVATACSNTFFLVVSLLLSSHRKAAVVTQKNHGLSTCFLMSGEVYSKPKSLAVLCPGRHLSQRGASLLNHQTACFQH